MASIVLTDPVAGVGLTAGLHATNYGNLRTLLNGGIDNTNIAAGAAILGSKIQFSEGAAPPGSPSQNDLWLYRDALSNNWLFRYNAASGSAFKWECIGGTPVEVYVFSAESTSSGVFVDLTTVGPQYTLPRAGDYSYEFGAAMRNLSGTVGGFAQAELFVGGGGTGVAAIETMDTASYYHQASTSWKNNGSALGAVAKLQYSISNGVSTEFSRRWLKVMPIRVS